MSKTTKALAILGVVAGLGVAALPFNAMAADIPVRTDGAGDGKTISADDIVEVKTTIKDYISIEINEASGNGDEVTLTPEIDPEEEGATHPAKHVLDLGTLANNSMVSGGLLVNVKTNNSKGYNLNIKAAGANMVGAFDETNHLIPGGTPAAGGTSAWGFKAEAVTANIDDDTTAAVAVDSKYSGDYVAVPYTAAETIATYNKATIAEGLDTKVTFAVSADASQAADTYSQTVTFTAATIPVVTEEQQG